MEYSNKTNIQREELGKPILDLTTIDGNAYSIMGAVSKVLRRAGYSTEAIEEYTIDSQSDDYDHLIQVAMNWVGSDEDDPDLCADCGEKLWECTCEDDDE